MTSADAGALPPILDPCCGGRMFYFDHDDPNVLFCDIREDFEKVLCDGRDFKVSPDMTADVTSLPFLDEQFPVVIFDPPHLTSGAGWQVDKYGKLPKGWHEWMVDAFAECWRVVRQEGVLVFKWNETHVPLSEILKCAPANPICGNRRPAKSKTHWLLFFKERRGA